MDKTRPRLARGFLFGCWLAVLIALAASPPLRQLALEQSRASSPLEAEQSFSALDAGRIPAPSVARLAIVPLPRPKRVDAREWARSHPENVMAQVEAAYQTEIGQPNGQSSAMRKSFDAAISRFPDQPWLYAARLRYTFGEFSHLGETMVDFENTTEQPGRRQYIMPLSPDIAESLRVARRGGELEPDNAFFDFCASLLHIQAGRTDLAVRSLLAAGRKKGFNEHLGDDNMARIENKRAQGPQIFERELAISAAMMLPQYAVMREAARRFVHHAQVLEQRGEHARALEIYGALLQVGAGMRDGETMITSFVGRAIQAVAIARGLKAPAPKNAATPSASPSAATSNSESRADEIRAAHLRAFVTYAWAQGRADLARRAEEEMRIDSALRQAQASRTALDETTMGIQNTLLEKTSALWRIGAALLLQIALGVAALIPLGTWRFRLPRGERREVSKLDTASAVLPPVVAVGACAWMAWGGRAHDMALMWGGAQEGVVPASIRLAWGAALAPLLLVAVWCVLGSRWSRRGRAQDSGSLPREKRAQTAVNRVGALVLGLGWLMLSGLALAILLVPVDANNGETATLVRWLLAVEGAIVLALHLFLRRHAREHALPAGEQSSRVATRAVASNGLERARRALCWTTALAAVAWVALAVTSLPLRAQAQAELDSYMKNGEVSELRQRAGLPAK